MPVCRKPQEKFSPSQVPESSPLSEQKTPTPRIPFDFTDLLPENEDAKAIADDQRSSIYALNFDVNGIDIETALDKRLLHNIRRQYRELLPLQEYCTEILLHENKNNLLVKSPTGSGKTAAFSIPAVQIAITHKSKTGPSVIIICNTQNLAKQIHDNLRCLTGKVPFEDGSKIPPPKDTGVTIFAMYSGGDSFQSLRHFQPDIVVATMGYLLKNIEDKKLNLTNLRLFIADEADKMIVGGGFFVETEKFLGWCREKVPIFQIAAFSATFDYFNNGFDGIEMNSQSMRLLYQNENPVFVNVEGSKGYITQRVIRIEKTDRANSMDRLKDTLFMQKLSWLCALLDHDKELNYRDGKYEKTTVVFVDRIVTSNFLAIYLMGKGYHVAPFNSSFELVDGNKTIEKWNNGEIQAVISTNKMARGQDIPLLNHVIVFDMSNEFQDYKHRIGRTGRIGKGGLSTALVSEQDGKHFCKLYEFMKEHNQDIPDWLHDVYIRTENFPQL